MSLDVGVCPNGHASASPGRRCRECGAAFERTVDVSDAIGEVVSWTVAHATPPGVRSPNPLAFVAFEVEETTVTILGGVTTEDVGIGDAVEPVYVDELRDPEAGIRQPDSQAWDGYRFRPLEE